MLAVVLALLGAAAGAVLATRSAQTHAANATILVDPLEGNPFSPVAGGDDLLNLETEAQLVASDPVAILVAERLDTEAPTEEILEGLSTSVRPNTQILDIEYTAPNEADAVARAQAFAEVFLDFRRSRALAARFDSKATIEDRLEVESQQLSSLIKERANSREGSAQAAVLSQQISTRTAFMGELRTQLAQYEGGTTDPGQIVTPAAAESPTPMSSPVAMAVLGGVLGALAAFGARLLRAPGRGRVRHVADLESLELPVLGAVSGREVRRVGGDLVLGGAGDPELGPGFRKLRVAVLTRERRRPVAIMVAAATAGDESAPSTGLGLAMGVALAELETVLVDATGTEDGVSKALGLDGEAGLTELLRGSVSIDEALVPLVPNLTFLPRGDAPVDLDDLVVNREMNTLVADLKKRCDVVLVLTRPIVEPAGEALAGVVDAVVVEAHQGTGRVRDLAEMADDQMLVDRLLGVVYVEHGRSRRSRGAGA